MKFFIPKITDDKTAEQFLDGIIKYAEETTGRKVKPRRIYSIRYDYHGKTYMATVGEVLEGEGLVTAILESDQTYLVCTPERGVLRGSPILVGRNTAIKVTDFSPEAT